MRRLSVAVLWFEDRTADPASAHWRYAAGLLKSSLKEVKALRLLSEGAVRYAYRQVGLRAGGPIDPNRARLMGEHIEAQRVISGRYSRQDDQWHVDLHVTNVATGAVSPVLSATANDWFDVRDRLNEQVLAALGVIPSTGDKERLSRRWTRSADALEWCLKAYTTQEEGQPASRMEECFRKALAADPNCSYAYMGLATTLATQGNFNPGEDAAQKAIQLEPDDAQAHAALGWVFAAQGQMDRAKSEFRQACQLDRDNAACLSLLARIYMEEGGWEEATAFLEIAVSLDRTDATAHSNLAKAYAVRKRREEALRELEEARHYLSEGMYAVDALWGIAETCESLGRRFKAIEYYERTSALAKKLAVNPDTIRRNERRIQRIKSTLTPTFINASMPQRYTEEALHAVLRDRLTETERQLAANPFSCTDTMRQWTQELTRGAATDLDKAKAIFDGMAVRLDAQGRPKSRTAREAFEAWKNTDIRLVCMDHAILFTALARAVDVNAFFVNVTKDPDGDVVNHACGAVFLGDRAVLVDTLWRWFGVPHKQYAILDDVQTTAFLCFNNRENDPRELAVCRAGLKLWPDYVPGRLALVAGLRRAGQWQEARHAFAEIPQPQSEDYEAAIYWALAGESAGNEQDWERAKECLLKSISIQPRQSHAYFTLGKVYGQQHRLAEARTAFRDCLRNDPSPLTAGTARAAIAQINEEIGLDPLNDSAPAQEKSP